MPTRSRRAPLSRAVVFSVWCGACLAPRGRELGSPIETGGATSVAGEALPAAIAPDPDVARPMPAYDVRETQLALGRLTDTLRRLARRPLFALGHEDATAYGVGWKGDANRSDVASLCGSHVAVYGWDVFGLERDARANGDGVDFDHLRRLIADAYERGGINTISWHADNPASGGDAWDNRGRAVAEILPGRRLGPRYRAHLDRVANYLQTLRGPAGELIPIIFRPYHEHTGSWFWWGGSNATAEEYVELWRFTVDYLRDERGLKNLLFAFSPSAFEVRTDDDYLYRYPGDAYVDVFGVDVYFGNGGADVVRVAEIASRVARRHGKVAAITEFGPRGGINGAGIDADWIRRSVLQPLKNNPEALGIAYALAWRNASAEHAFLPYPGHAGAQAFRQFCGDPVVLLERDLPP